MSGLFATLGEVLLGTLRDVLPIAVILFVFQALVLRKRVPHVGRVLLGFGYVVAGLTLFLAGLDQALFPLGDLMARQLTDPAFITGEEGAEAGDLIWHDYYWVYLFGATIGFATAMAEPALIAVAIKANQVSGGVVGVWGLRVAVGIGAALGIAIGALRIVTGIPLAAVVSVAYALVIIQTFLAPRAIIPLAYDSGGVTTSTVTVPIVTALGLGLAGTIPGRDPVLDGFGMIATTCLFPIVTVMAYAQLSDWRARRRAG
ncbi:Protein of unknown function [Thiohalospira halophila DSM 15071]|uniref:DUF1538 domain-containing protein n=1 Tax=Thiohalospira halophila DSM 15071 TaxID=1123397 RepID=A0A1I1Q0E1_9GAMM|nr:DUF1538 domain-containing protein [Thiohalospira halophila]SFD15402.1 Protein of unknown function [Thiohalospira halophila DSM 15071]